MECGIEGKGERDSRERGRRGKEVEIREAVLGILHENRVSEQEIKQNEFEYRAIGREISLGLLTVEEDYVGRVV